MLGKSSSKIYGGVNQDNTKIGGRKETIQHFVLHQKSRQIDY